MVRTFSFVWLATLVVLMLASVPELSHYIAHPDSGYQLSLGWLTLCGQFPFVDVLQHYGPLVTFTSAAAQTVHPSAISEAVTCALGYALALYCLFDIFQAIAPGRRYMAIAAGVAVSLAGWVLLARFYKWYYWLFQVLTLALLARIIANSSRAKRSAFAVGLLTGIAFLYRHDLGAACFVTCFVVLAATWWPARQDRPWWTKLALLVSGFALPILAWFVVLSSVGGVSACGGYLSTIWIGSARIGQNLFLPFPRWDWHSPTSPDSCRFLILAFMAVSYAMGIVWGGITMVRSRGQWTAEDSTLFAAGLLGVLVSPQGLYRSDVQHLLQVLPPLLVIDGILLLRLTDRQRTKQPVGAFAAALLLALLVFPFWHQRYEMAYNRGPLAKALPTRLRHLAQGLDVADPKLPVAQVARFVRQHTSPGDSILVPPLLPQVYYWAARPMSGLVHAYAGIFATDALRSRNLAAVRKNPPRLLVVDKAFLESDRESLFVRFNPELHAWLKARYPRIVFQSEGLAVCDVEAR